MNKRVSLIKLLAQPYALEILRELKKPRRYRDLKKVCGNDRTLSKRLRELTEIGYIEAVALRCDKGKFANYYKLTKKGIALLEKVKKIERM